MLPTLSGLWALSVPVLGIPAITFWPYLAGTVALVLGFAFLPKQEIARASGLDKLLWFGPSLVSIAVAVFGADHFVTINFVTMIVPEWMPWRMFWAYFVGCALLAAALSLTTKIYWRLAATMLGSMLFLFVVLLHIPNLFRFPHESVIRTLLLRDLTMGAGIFAFGVSHHTLGPRLISIARFLVAFPVAVFGFEHFRHPALAPGFPQDDPSVVITLPAWIPAHALWAYVTGAIFILCAVGLTTKVYARLAAKTLGLTVLLFVFIAYVPRTIAAANNVAGGLNYLAIHCMLSGAAFMLALSIPAAWCEARESRPAQLQEISVPK